MILLLGNVDHEGITSALKSGGEQYKKKLLASSSRNWTDILAYFYGYTVRAVIAKLSYPVYHLLRSPNYSSIARDLLANIAKTRHAIFVYEDFFPGASGGPPLDNSDKAGARTIDEEEDADGESYELSESDAIMFADVNRMLCESGLNLIPYRTNAEVTVIASRMLQEVVEGLLFRVYVPAGRLWANEIDRLLDLFRDYLTRTGRRGIRLNQVRTEHGVSYEFHGDESSPSELLADEFHEFSRLLDLCISDPPKAELMLKEKVSDPAEIVSILSRYSREAKRIRLDLRHEREKKLLGIRQRLEAELNDIVAGEAEWQLIERLAASAVPESYSISSLSSGAQGLPMASMAGSKLTINIRPQIIQTVRGIVAQELVGNVDNSGAARELAELIEMHGGKDAQELKNAMQILSDPEIPKPDRMTSAKRVKGFVLRVAETIGPVATQLTTAYIEAKLGLK
ncbi:MAG: hypothetical protein WCC14_20525 [Acidobacteriaceae bacterium]